VACQPAEEREFLSPKPGTPDPSQAVSVLISPRSASVAPGRSLRFVATAYGSNGRVVPAEVQWVATGGVMSHDGTFTAGDHGRVVIQAHLKSAPSIADSVTVAVFSDPTDIIAIRVVPDSIELYEGEGIQLRLEAERANGQRAESPAVEWTASGGAVNGAGWFEPAGTGQYVVTASVSRGPRGYTRVFVRPRVVVLTQLRVHPSTVSLPAGTSQKFEAVAEYSNGTREPAPVTWSATGGTVTEAGEFTAGSTVGTFRVVARHVSGALADTAYVQVTEPAVVGVSVSPKAPTVAVSASQQFVALARLSDGSQRSAGVAWRATGGSVSATGLYKAPTQPGTYQVIAEVPGTAYADSSTVTVFVPVVTLTRLIVNPSAATVGAGASQQFQVTAMYSDGTTGTPAVQWFATGGSITPQGLFVAGSVPGSYRVIALEPTSGRADTSTVTVLAPTVTRVTLEPKALSLLPGASFQMTARALYSDGAWRSPVMAWDATGGQMSATGVYMAGSTPGTYRIIASVEGYADTSLVTIEAPTPVLTGLTISPSSASVQSGSSRQFQVTPMWSDGQSRPATVTWSATGGTVSSSGLFVAGSVPGTYRVIASSGSLADTASVTVTAVPVLTGIEINPDSVVLDPGEQHTFSAVGRYSNGNTGSVSVTWTANGGTIRRSGLYTAGQTPGNYRVIAVCACGFRDTAWVTIRPPTVVAPALQAVDLSPAAVTLNPGATQQFQVLGRLSNGSTTPVTVSYSATGGTMSGSTYTAGSTPGTYRVIATETATGLADTSSITIVNPAPVLTAVELTPEAVTLQPGQVQQFSAVGRYSNGTTGSVSVTWSATGGTMSSSSPGRYTAGQTPGNFVVIATCVSCSMADTARVTISNPAPVLSAIELTPAAVTLPTGGTQQFSVIGRMSDGSTSAVTVLYTTNGGSVSNSGLYTAPQTAGTYRLIATLSGGQLADTSSITVQAPAPPPQGTTILFRHGFDDGRPGPGADIWAAAPTTAAIVTDATAIGGRSVRMTFQSGDERHGGISVGGWPGQKRLYVRFRYKQDATANNSGIKKTIRFLWNDQMIGTFNIQWGEWIFFNDYTGQGNYNQTAASVTSHGPNTFRGQWRWIEFMLDYGTPGQYTVRQWVDGVLILDRTVTASVPSNLVITGFVLGWVFNTPADNRSEWWDEVTVATGPLGMP
jgi:hypothetical protein